MSAREEKRHGQERSKSVRPYFRPRVIVKFHDWVRVEYHDGAEREIAKRFGEALWRKIEQSHGPLTLVRLYTSVPQERLQAMIEEATRRDDSYRPPNFFTWYTVDCPDGMRSEELAKILLTWDIVEKAYPDAPAVDPMPVSPDDDPRRPNQGYLDAAPDGIDAEFAWFVPGGDGTGQRFIDLEQGWTLDHEDLTDHGASLLFGSLTDTSRAHGTAVLGEICMVDNTIGGIGITPNIASVDVVSHSGSLSNVSDAIIAALDTLEFGHLLLLEVQTVTPAAPVFGAPIELLDDVFESVRLASALGVIVIEAGGNGANNLDTTTNFSGLLVFNPVSPDFRDSGAIIIGAATSTVPHMPMAFTSFGARIDCYAWGQNVDTSSSNSTGATTLYTATFGGTSSASPIVAGAALAIQGIMEASVGYRLSPAQIRNILRDPATGTPSANPAADRIGVMPNLRAIIEDTLGIGFSDVYLRDFPGDTGDPHTGSISASPDVILRPNPVPDPQAAYGEGSGTENSSTLGYEAVAGQDNFIYARVRNRGEVQAADAEVTVYWSEVATLITPDMWNFVGTQIIPSVPVGDVLTVADAIVWPSTHIPATGHYCFVAMVGTGDDPVPSLADLMNFDNFRAFIRNNNNVTWRNFNVISSAPDPADPAVAMPFIIAGAPDRALAVGIEVIARLPRGAHLMLEAPIPMIERFGYRGRQFKADRQLARLSLRPQGVNDLGPLRLPARFRGKVRLLVVLPESAQKQDGWQVAVRQYLIDDRQEIGRVTWYLASPAFFERRKRVEECLWGRR